MIMATCQPGSCAPEQSYGEGLASSIAVTAGIKALAAPHRGQSLQVTVSCTVH